MRFKIFLFVGLLAISVRVQAAAINNPAPSFTLKNTDGVEHKLTDYKGDVVLVNFWATWCAPCAIEFPELNKLADEYKDRKLHIVAINVDRKSDGIAAFLKKFHISPTALNILLDPQNKTVGAYDVDAMPSSFLIDRKGLVRFIHVGFLEKDPALWRAEANKLLAEQ